MYFKTVKYIKKVNLSSTRNKKLGIIGIVINMYMIYKKSKQKINKIPLCLQKVLNLTILKLTSKPVLNILVLYNNINVGKIFQKGEFRKMTLSLIIFNILLNNNIRNIKNIH